MPYHHSKAVPISEITVPPDRQRKEMKGIEELARSLAAVGLINPLVVTEDLVLVAGERRLTAAKSISWTHIDVRLVTDLTPNEAKIIEFEENAKRLDLSWQEVASAVLSYHEAQVAEHPDWTVQATADALSYSKAWVSTSLDLAREFTAGNDAVLKCDGRSVAVNLLSRLKQRQSEVEDARLLGAFDVTFGGEEETNERAETALAPTAKGEAPAATPVPPVPTHPFLLTDFVEWADQPFSGTKFNFLHCDFPYGIGYSSFNGGMADDFGGYKDSPDVYFALLQTLSRIMPTHVANAAHMMFWLSPKYLSETTELLRATGWTIQPYPLIWFRSDNAGILPDPKRGPRQVYEICLMCTRGDRYIVRAVSNLFACPKPKSIHASEKPYEMLSHFFRMFVDNSTVMLDPTMGSGNAVRAAEDAGAKYVLGLEQNKEFYEASVARYLSLE